ncbi:MAG: ATP-binding protein [Anaerolineae bacterium]
MDEQAVWREKEPGKRLGILRVKARLENVPLAIDCVAKLAQKVGLDKRTLYEIQLAVDEACANVADHAYRGEEPGDMEVSCYLENQLFTIRVRDWGRGFDPDSVVIPDVDAPLEERTLGGLGLFIVRQVMDYVQFTVDPKTGNELKMAKRL